MALLDTANPLVPSSRRGDNFGVASATYHFSTWISDMMIEYQAHKKARATRQALSVLSDRALEDIGLNRGDIVSGTYRGL